PSVVYFDEPSAGLDPVSAARRDDLILQLRDTLGMTVIVVTHELASIFAISNNSAFLDAKTRTMIATGDPHELLHSGPDDVVEFLTRGRGRGHGELH
ncbi:MAG: polyamine ABC transporter ATP-binding protein, partial [Mailhella sp.]|nr:polyamine ABC transporter ATP-binding protein [Mailhella sp.]